MATGQYPCQTSRAFTVKRRKLTWFGHVCRQVMVIKIMPQGTVDGGRRRGGPRKSRKENVIVWTGQSMSSLTHCCAQQTIEVDGQPSQWRHLSEYPNDAWA